MQRFGRAGAGGDHRKGRGPRAPQVLVRQVQQVLVVRVGVDRGHDSVANAEVLQQYLGHRRQAVGRAGGVGDDLVLARIIGVLVHAQHDRHVRVLGRGRDDHPLGAGREVLAGSFVIGEAARGLDHQINAQVLPGQLLGVLQGQDLDRLAVDDEFAVARLHVRVQRAVHRVVLQQIGERLGIREVVNRDEVQLRIVQRCPKDVPADPAEPIDSNANSHVLRPAPRIKNEMPAEPRPAGERIVPRRGGDVKVVE